MQYVDYYETPLGEILLAADQDGLTGLWFSGQKYYASRLDPEPEEKDLPVFDETRRWLEVYFAGKKPDFMPPIHMVGTPFQIAVWEIMRRIPYGETATYGEIAREFARERGLPRMSAQAVGSAVAHNRISILIPCHRVTGSNGSLTGYAGGLDRKVKLLTLEKVDMKDFFVPHRGTAL